MENNKATNHNTTNNNIAKNALLLYVRMFITMLVGLYTSRVILQVLGVEDYGIYNVVGGFVTMFSLISSSLSGAISRFLTYELGIGNLGRLKSVFSSSILVQLILAIIIIVLAETVGLWFLNNMMVIPKASLSAAFWVFQFSLVTFTLNLISVPYNAAIVAHERMDIYAYISIFEVVCKLLICYVIVMSPIDKLVFYSILLCMVGVSVQSIYMIFCKRTFFECVFHIEYNKQILKQMFGFASWNFIGSSASILRTQGASILLNLFGGPVVNAANGISTTICGVVSNFVGNFTTAFSPQITKKYAAKEYESLIVLIIYSSKISFYLMFLITLPVMLNTEFILQKWLGIVPNHTVLFVQLTLIYLLSDSISRPLIIAKNATGQIRNYQLVVGGILLLMLPLSYIALNIGAPVEVVMISNILTSFTAYGARMYMLRGDFPNWSSRFFFFNVFCKVVIVGMVSSVIPVMVSYLIENSWLRLTSTTLISIISIGFTAYYIGCTKRERKIVNDKFKIIKIRFKK